MASSLVGAGEFSIEIESALGVKCIQRDFLAEQKLGSKGYKLELKETLAQYKRELKEIVLGLGVWFSERAVIIAIVSIEALIVFFGILGMLYAKSKLT